MRWDPPTVDTPILSLAATRPCSLPDVLDQVGQRARQLVDHLQNFDAREEVHFEQTDQHGNSEADVLGQFDYMVDFGQRSDVFHVRETRTSLAGSNKKLSVDMVDTGLPALALIFHPSLRTDYEFRCEGFSPWRNQGAWVVYFRQIEGRRPRTAAIATPTEVYPIRLKGRAWIAADSGEVMHLETNLAKQVAMICNCAKRVVVLEANAVSVDYAPVKFRSENTDVWLPQSAVAYSDYGYRRLVIEHSFSDFQLFSVQTQQIIGAPKEP
ncbi:MAG TPA: hypothetical protein VEJ67_08770 [Candidatus Cybelea sp.]|nr:hypothetical protein [Candidatus Cybelea sp.]